MVPEEANKGRSAAAGGAEDCEEAGCGEDGDEEEARVGGGGNRPADLAQERLDLEQEDVATGLFEFA